MRSEPIRLLLSFRTGIGSTLQGSRIASAGKHPSLPHCSDLPLARELPAANRARIPDHKWPRFSLRTLGSRFAKGCDGFGVGCGSGHRTRFMGTRSRRNTSFRVAGLATSRGLMVGCVITTHLICECPRNLGCEPRLLLTGAGYLKATQVRQFSKKTQMRMA